ncbi:MAG: hypothetical protein AAGB51_12155 [Planctomycetota bacterium]
MLRSRNTAILLGLSLSLLTPIVPTPEAASLAWAAVTQDGVPRPCLITFPNGLKLFGVLTERTETVVTLRVGEETMRFEADGLASVEPAPGVLARYAELRAATNEEDPAQLLRLAQWLFGQRLYDASLRELDASLALDPGSPRAQQLRLVIGQQRLLDLGAARRMSIDGATAPEVREPAPEGPAQADQPGVPMLGPDQINLIKVYEVDLRDPPRMRIDREAVERFMEAYSDDERVPSGPEARESILRKPAHEILELMFRLRARDFYNEVRVEGLPGPLESFRDDIHNGWLQNRCATNRCHGGESAGRLWLATDRPRTERTAMTNFLILDRFRMADGTPLIDWEVPDRSPLLHMGLPRNLSRHPHPEVVVRGGERGWRQVFRSEDDRVFRDAVRWIESMFRPRPEYPVTYEPAVPRGAIPEPEDLGDPGR